MKTIGERVVDAIIRGGMVKVHCPASPNSGCIVTWSANVHEQLTELIERWPTHCRKCGDKLTGHEDDSATHCR